MHVSDKGYMCSAHYQLGFAFIFYIKVHVVLFCIVFSGMRLAYGALTISPLCPEGATYMKIRNFQYLGNALDLVNPVTLSATDNFTGVTVYSSWGALTTRLSTDPGFQDGDDLVTK